MSSTKKGISVKGETYDAIKQAAYARGTTPGKLVEAIVLEALGDGAAPVLQSEVGDPDKPFARARKVTPILQQPKADGRKRSSTFFLGGNILNL